MSRYVCLVMRKNRQQIKKGGAQTWVKQTENRVQSFLLFSEVWFVSFPGNLTSSRAETFRKKIVTQIRAEEAQIEAEMISFFPISSGVQSNLLVLC